MVGYAETGDSRFISTAGDAAYVVIELNVTDEASVDVVDRIRAAIVPPAGFTYQLTGYGPITKDSAVQSEKDLQKAELVSLPIVALVLILVFASLVAAGMPLLVAGLAIPTALPSIYIVAQQVEMSIFVLNIATMLGLALAIDYSLFIVSRFREELRRGRTVEEAVERAVGDRRQGRRIQRRGGRDRALRLADLQGTGHPLDRDRRLARRALLRRLCAGVPAGHAGHARPSRQCAVHPGPAPPLPPGRRRPRGRAHVALGARGARGHASPDRRPGPVPRIPAVHRQPVPADGTGRPRRRDLPARRREPRRLCRAADRIRARARRRRSSSWPTSPARRPTPPTSRRSTPTRPGGRARRRRPGREPVRHHTIRRPARS